MGNKNFIIQIRVEDSLLLSMKTRLHVKLKEINGATFEKYLKGHKI